MKPKGVEFYFSAKVWQHQGQGGWYFVSLPVEISKEIRDSLQFTKEGWGRLKADAKIGNTNWKTAIWFDTKHNTYLLPIKASVRKAAQILVDEMISIYIWV